MDKIKILCENECKINNLECFFFQSNHEGELIEKIHSVEQDFEGIIINPAAYTHTSIALLDALRATSKPKIEVHISNIAGRESFRHESLISPVAEGCIFGFGLQGYEMAIDYLIQKEKRASES